MARTRTVDFLPQIFQTDTNKQFLAATLDQLVAEPKFKKTQGFIGRRVGPGVNPNDNYVVEPTKTRADYQLEAGIVSLKPDTSDIQNVIRDLKQKNIGVLITDHNVRETLGIVDEAYIMNNGELLVNGTPEEILNSEKARKFYLGSHFRL